MATWVCSTCGFVYESPIAITGWLRHKGPLGTWHRLRKKKEGGK